ncbi:hypothetical protein SCHPADRAFT_940803 [Schizopora paradoxa]|uniref:Uncharacterized protein n=1 Tax=Schizopora paradoxa TaxID=27342 RepID=A0A0H2S7Y5_9AGAM|nr:hypothetical protein SCHPADRAFT_940803 [Schizopora paradoxa]
MVTKNLYFQPGELSSDGRPFDNVQSNVHGLNISEFQTSVWDEHREVSDNTGSHPDGPPAYAFSARRLEEADHDEVQEQEDFARFSSSCSSTTSGGLDLKDEFVEYQHSTKILPCTPLTLSPTSSTSGSNRSRSHTTFASRLPISPPIFNSNEMTKVQMDICKVILDLLEEVARCAHLPTSLDLLESCATTCHAHRIPFSILLQEASIAGHTLLYWVIVRWKSLHAENQDHGNELLYRLISFAAPLSPSSIADLRLGCLHLGREATGDVNSGAKANAVFQQLRRNPIVNSPCKSDAILLEPVSRCTPEFGRDSTWDQNRDFHSSGTFEDDVQVLEIPGSFDRFVVKLQLKCFLRRMSVTRSVKVEFIARGRAWILQLFVIPPENHKLDTIRGETASQVDTLRYLARNHSDAKGNGGKTSDFTEGTWAVSLGLLSGSSPVVHGLSARLVIPPARTLFFSETEFCLQVRERGLVEDHSHRRDAEVQKSSRAPCKTISCDPLVTPCSSCKGSVEGRVLQKDTSEERNFDFFRYITRVFSRPPTTSPGCRESLKIRDRTVELELDSYLNNSRVPHLLAPALPRFPSIFNPEKGKAVDALGRLANETLNEAGVFDVLACFEDCDELFDGGLHIDSKGALNAILEVQLLK